MPISLTGPITIACLVILGVFVYPWLLRRPAADGSGRGPGGWILVAIATAALIAIYGQFARDTQPQVLRWGLGALWAVAPVVAALIVLRIERR
ncbi:MAG TPA: hypothetical protein VMU33_05310 [Burkholderiaceae bacterium]|nr:hypothetical protein [Burkholderiaceae bacterium]